MKILAFWSFAVVSLFSQSIQWEPTVDMDGQIFPSYIVATSTVDFTKLFPSVNLAASKNNHYLGDINGQIGIFLLSPAQPSSFDLEISVSKFIKKSSISGKLDDPNQKYSIFPTIEYDYDALLANNQPMPETLTFSLKINGQSVGEKKKVVQTRSVGDCLFAVQGIPLDF